MNDPGKKGMTLFVKLALILSVLAVFPPVGATAGKAGNFAVTVNLTNDTGAPMLRADVGDTVNINANVSIVDGGVNVTRLILKATVNNVAIPSDTSAAPLVIGAFALNTWHWIPVSYGIFTINITAINGTDTAIQTVQTSTFRIAATDFEIGPVTVTPDSGLTNITDFSIVAMVSNYGDFALTLTVNFKLDNNQLLGYQDLGTGGMESKMATLVTNFGGLNISNGVHTVTVSLSGQRTPSKVSNNITLTNPAPDVIITGVDASANPVTIQNGMTHNVTITAHLKNNGSQAASNFTVKFYETDTTTPKGTVVVTETIHPGGSTNLSWNWTITDTLTLGVHTIYVGVGPENGDRYWASIKEKVNDLSNVTISEITATPSSVFEGGNVTLAVKLVNNGTDNATGLTVEFFEGNTAIGARTDIIVLPGGEAIVPSLVVDVGALTADKIMAYRAKLGTSEMTVTVTARDLGPKIDIVSFSVQDSWIDDTVTFSATVKNNGFGAAANMTVDFYEGSAKIGNSTAFNLTTGSFMDVSVSIKLTGNAGSYHTFHARTALGGEMNITKTIANISIVSLKVTPTSKQKQPKDSTQDFKITIVLQNSGELKGGCILNLTDGKKLITDMPLPVELRGGANTTATFIWKVKGEGDHTCVATLSSVDGGSPSTASVKATLHYAPGFEVLALIGAMLVALVLLRRRKD